MKSTFLSIATTCLFLTACAVTSDNPLSPPETAHADSRLLGVWHEDKDQTTFHVTAGKGPWMHVDINSSDSPNQKDSYDFYPTVIDKNSFLNVVLTGKDEQGHETKAYTLIRYEFSGKNTLQMWMMSTEAVAGAIQAGKLKGTVHQNGSMIDHSDPDVALQGSSADLKKFLQKTDLDSLFSNERAPLHRQ